MGFDVWTWVAGVGTLAAVVWWRPPVASRLRERRSWSRAPAWLAGRPGALPLRVRAVAGGVIGLVAWSWLGWAAWGVAAWVVVWAGATVGLGFFSSGSQTRRREEIVMALPQTCDLLSVCLESGLPLRRAVAAVADVIGAPMAECLHQVVARVSLGMSEREAWEELRDQPGLESLGREVGRCLSSGLALAGVLKALAVEARREAMSIQEVRAKRVGVRSVLPLMACFLPAFVLLGIVPIIGGVVSHLLP